MDTTQPLPNQLLPLVYTGIGSRKIDRHVIAYLQGVGAAMAARGYSCRTGDAIGSDNAFWTGAVSAGGTVHAYAGLAKASRPDARPFKSLPIRIQELANEIAKRFHPRWDQLTDRDKAWMARNVVQVLGEDLESPSRVVLCYAKGSRFLDGKLCDVAGGTGQAVRVAYAQGIPVFNLAIGSHRDHVAKRISLSLSSPEAQLAFSL